MSVLNRCVYDKNVNGTLYRLAVSSAGLKKEYHGNFVVCLKDYPSLSVKCTINEKTNNVYADYPPYPEAVFVGIIFLSIVTAFVCGVTVRYYIVWYKLEHKPN